MMKFMEFHASSTETQSTRGKNTNKDEIKIYHHVQMKKRERAIEREREIRAQVAYRRVCVQA